VTSAGEPQIYARPFVLAPGDGGGPKWLVSKGPGVGPRWNEHSNRVFYSTTALQFMAVDVDTSAGFRPLTPREIFPTPRPPFLNVWWDYDPPRRRFLFPVASSPNASAPFTVIVNWAASNLQTR
jgi:hypothetical protein